jgi:hypothetical protein
MALRIGADHFNADLEAENESLQTLKSLPIGCSRRRPILDGAEAVHNRPGPGLDRSGTGGD